jgi:hypothetical protein
MHCPSRIVVADYVYRLCFAHSRGYEVGSFDGFGIEELDALIENPRNTWHRKPLDWEDTHRCDICGSRHMSGGVFQHRPSGEHIIVGWMCAEKLEMMSVAARADKNRVDRWTISELERAKNKRDRRAALRRFVGEQIAAGRNINVLLKTDHRIVREMRAKLMAKPKWGLSEKQIALCEKLKREADERAAHPEEVEQKVGVPVTDARVTVVGEVVSVKVHESYYGDKDVMTVKVTTDDGIWLTWGTVPNSILWDDEFGRGCTVQFDAKINVSDTDASFSFFKRPTKATITSPRVKRDDKDENPKERDARARHNAYASPVSFPINY